MAVEQGVGVTEDAQLLALGRPGADVVEVEGDPPPLGDLPFGEGVGRLGAVVDDHDRDHEQRKGGEPRIDCGEEQGGDHRRGHEPDHPSGEGQGVHQRLAPDAEDLEAVDHVAVVEQVDRRHRPEPLEQEVVDLGGCHLDEPQQPVGRLPVADDGGGEEAEPGDHRSPDHPTGVVGALGVEDGPPGEGDGPGDDREHRHQGEHRPPPVVAVDEGDHPAERPEPIARPGEGKRCVEVGLSHRRAP